MDEEKTLKEIGVKLRELRIKKGYKSLEIFAYEHNLGRVQYWRHESGVNMTLKSLIRLLNIHNISLEEFFRGL